MQNERNDREEPNAAHCVYYNDYYYVGDGMREAKFTKGPWVVHLNKVGVVDTSDTQSYGMLDVVAVVDAWDFAEQHEHNAHLIAAAPELYDELLDRYTQTKCGCAHPACRRCADDNDTEHVLAKARGEILKHAT